MLQITTNKKTNRIKFIDYIAIDFKAPKYKFKQIVGVKCMIILLKLYNI